MVVEIEFTLDDRYSIKSINVVRGSVNTEYDESAIQATRLAAPFSELAGFGRRDYGRYFQRVPG